MYRPACKQTSNLGHDELNHLLFDVFQTIVNDVIIRTATRRTPGDTSLSHKSAAATKEI